MIFKFSTRSWKNKLASFPRCQKQQPVLFEVRRFFLTKFIVIWNFRLLQFSTNFRKQQYSRNYSPLPVDDGRGGGHTHTHRSFQNYKITSKHERLVLFVGYFWNHYHILPQYFIILPTSMFTMKLWFQVMQADKIKLKHDSIKSFNII